LIRSLAYPQFVSIDEICNQFLATVSDVISLLASWIMTLGSAALLFLSMSFSNALSLVHLNSNVSPFDSSPKANTSLLMSCDTNPNHSTCMRDSLHVYGDGVLLPRANPQTFVVLGEEGYYGKDDSNVYWIIVGEEGPDPHQIIGADSQTFSPILGSEAFSKDKNHVYFLGYAIPDADPATFIPTYPPLRCGLSCLYDSYDKNHKYWRGQIAK
jgi:hypothetical protein